MGILLEGENGHLSFLSQAQKGCLAVLRKLPVSPKCGTIYHNRQRAISHTGEALCNLQRCEHWL